ncbi:MAG: DUF5320 domain-containing protein [Candidatus Marinimicrobia bacterium]|nr:DUF5320 domain-containing protein [Candidatus Neomarinimicrobiota bacterium]MCF7827564.1 DUF5320 domain-containing protein [Candidatus Neomarinimicrobiota bacterium]MCF7881574.1 DUF5320 domain-containing protein [Candidatus Neomarinimicrobiota bacterium]
MPGGDRSGPWGEGPMSGRGAGWCREGDRPGYASAPGFARGRRWFGGFGRGRGFGRGFTGFWRNRGDEPKEENLRQEAHALKNRLDELVELIHEFKSERKTKE